MAEPEATIRICAGTYDPIVITKDLTLIGAGDGADPASNTILDAEEQGRVVQVTTGHTVTLEGLRITGGSVIDDVGGGGVRVEFRSTVTMATCTVIGNSSDFIGGGIENNSGTLTLNGCSVDQNFSNGDGGGISLTGGALTLNGSSVTGNTAAGRGGGISANRGTVTLNDSTPDNCFARQGGAYIDPDGARAAP